MSTVNGIDRVNEVLDGHPRPCRFWLVGVPWFDPPSAILAALRVAGTAQSFPYPPAQGHAELREALCELHMREGGALSPEQVVVTHGAKGGIVAILACLLDPGSELIQPTPSYPAYAAITRTLGGTPVPIYQNNGCFSLTTDILEQHLTPRTRAVVLSSPSNPTGTVLRGHRAHVVVDFCRRHNLRLVCDEAYLGFGLPGADSEGPSSFDPRLGNVVLIRSFSKRFAVCGWRIGYVAADRGLASRVARWQSAILNPPNCIAQQALIAAPEVPRETFATNREEVRSRLQALATALTDAGLPAAPPEGGFYLWIDVRPLLAALGFTSSLELCLDLARIHGIGLWPGEDFHGPGFVRISAVGCPDDEWESAVSRLVAGIRSYDSAGTSLGVEAASGRM